MLGFGTALICELLEIPKSRTRRGSAATKLQARSEFTQIYKAAKRRVAQGHRQKKFPRVERTTSHKEKTICAKLVPIRTDVNASFVRFFSVTCTECYLAVSRLTLHVCDGPAYRAVETRTDSTRAKQAKFLAVTSRPNSLSSVLMFFAIEISRVTFDDSQFCAQRPSFHAS